MEDIVRRCCRSFAINCLLELLDPAVELREDDGPNDDRDVNFCSLPPRECYVNF